MKKIFCLGLLKFILSVTAHAQNQDAIITQTADKKLKETLSKIPAGSEAAFGFKYRNEFLKSKAGKPIRVLTLNKEDSLIELNEWRVPVKVDGRNVLLLTVRKNQQQFEVVDIGGTLLAKELQDQKLNDSKNQYLLRLYRLNADFIINTNENLLSGKITCKPLNSAKALLKRNSNNNIVTDLKLNEIKEL